MTGSVRTHPQLKIRRLTADDAEASRALGFEAFGMPKTPPTGPATLDTPGRRFWGGFDGDRLAARLAVRAYHSWFGGQEVPTAGVASVTVGMEYRGVGALGPLFQVALDEARATGAVISTLFPSAPGIYRRFGYELVSDYRTVRLPSELLARVASPLTTVGLRRATAEDAAEIDRVYTAWAARQNGPLTRRGVSFPNPAGYLDDFDGVTLALDPDGAVIGFASWDRGQGYGSEATLEVSDLLASTADGYRALLRAIGTFATITGHTKIDTSGDDLIPLFLPKLVWETTRSDPYMLSVIDVPGAVGVRRFGAGVSVDLGFAVHGHFVEEVNGGYRLRVEDGVPHCEPAPVEGGGLALSARGLALLYAGVQSCANLRFAGLLEGGTSAEDEALDALFGGRQFHIRNYF